MALNFSVERWRLVNVILLGWKSISSLNRKFDFESPFFGIVLNPRYFPHENLGLGFMMLFTAFQTTSMCAKLVTVGS